MSGPDDLTCPPDASAALVLDDGTVFFGHGFGAYGFATGEVVFNTAMSGYQEVLSDPSYAAQILTFTFPHIGNTGTTPEDLEATRPLARGAVVATDITSPSSWRAAESLSAWMAENRLTGIAGVDTRALTRRVRTQGPPNGTIAHAPEGAPDIKTALEKARNCPSMEGLDLAGTVSCKARYGWEEAGWTPAGGYGRLEKPTHHVVAVDYGIKRNILRCFAERGCRVTVVPARTPAEEILAEKPDGVFLSNGPGDPSATRGYTLPLIETLLEKKVPLFGICLGHQLLGLAAGARSYKMDIGHRGANHPVKNLETGRVEITSQNHGFAVDEKTLPKSATVTHRSLFDGSLEGFRLNDRPVLSIQYHPEASPGPQDSQPLFDEFIRMMETV